MHQSRLSDSPYVWGINRHFYTVSGGVTVPDGCWDLLFIKQDNSVEVVLTGPITAPIPLAFPPGTEVMNVTFTPDAFLPDLPATKMVNIGRPLPLYGRNAFRFAGATFEIPTFENAEAFVEKMLRLHVLSNDKLVASVLSGQPMAASERSVQRHFLQTTGMTMKFVQQVQRAQIAVDMLKAGQRIVDVAHALGYSDQAHMTKSLKGIMGVTPAAVAQAAQVEANKQVVGFLQNGPLPQLIK